MQSKFPFSTVFSKYFEIRTRHDDIIEDLGRVLSKVIQIVCLVQEFQFDISPSSYDNALISKDQCAPRDALVIKLKVG
jgi:hypothetical protein